jgi:hypothetical protein
MCKQGLPGNSDVAIAIVDADRSSPIPAIIRAGDFDAIPESQCDRGLLASVNLQAAATACMATPKVFPNNNSLIATIALTKPARLAIPAASRPRKDQQPRELLAREIDCPHDQNAGGWLAHWLAAGAAC